MKFRSYLEDSLDSHTSRAVRNIATDAISKCCAEHYKRVGSRAIDGTYTLTDSATYGRTTDATRGTVIVVNSELSSIGRHCAHQEI